MDEKFVEDIVLTSCKSAIVLDRAWVDLETLNLFLEHLNLKIKDRNAYIMVQRMIEQIKMEVDMGRTASITCYKSSADYASASEEGQRALQEVIKKRDKESR